MIGLVVKLITCPILVILSWTLFPNVDFVNWYQPIILGVLLAVVGHVMEILLLNRSTITLSTIADFIASTLIVFFVSSFFHHAFVTFFGAILTAAFLAVSEIFLHRWLVKSGKTQKKRTAN